MINIVCDVCGNKLPIMGDKQNRKSTTLRVGFCGYCETMAMKCIKLHEEREMNEDRMMKWFEYAHLPEHLQAVSKPFGDLAGKIVSEVDPGPERTVALRKLLEAKDAAVRAKLNPGG